MDKDVLAFVYPNTYMTNCLPIGLAKIMAVTNQPKLFYHTTYFEGENVNEIKNKIYHNDACGTYNITDIGSSIRDFVDRIESRTIIMSVMENTWHIALNLIKAWSTKNIVIGGPFITVAYNHIKHLLPKNVSVCIGEGEKYFERYLDMLHHKKLYEYIQYVDTCWQEDDAENGAYVNQYQFMPQTLMYRFINNKLQKVIPIEVHRGCPFSCSYCINSTRVHRNTKKDVSNIVCEIHQIDNQYHPDLIYFVGDIFLNKTQLKQYIKDMEHKIPYWMNTRPEFIDNEMVGLLKESGCVRCNIGLEHGNEEFRNSMLNRTCKTESIIQAVKAFKFSGITLVVNSIIGFPEEDYKLLQDTIDMNKRLLDENDDIVLSPFICTPYHGTKIREYCVEHKLINPSLIIAGGLFDKEPINVSKISTKQLTDVQHNFLRYVTGEYGL